MPTLIGGLVALVALAAGILARVEPVTSVQRAGLAFVLGVFLTQLWYVFFTVRVQKLSPRTLAGGSEADIDRPESVQERAA